jgi:hypothetical protein
MIPATSTVPCPSRPRRGLTLWIPVFALWLLLVVVAVVLLPILVIGCLFVRVNPLRAFVVFWQIITALRGTNIEFRQDGRSIRVRFP